jgi:hypothetical protein
VVETGASKCAPFKCYRGVVVIEEGCAWRRGRGQALRAPAWAGILTEPHYSGGEQESCWSTSRISSSRWLAAISAEALKVDRHAKLVHPGVFGDAAPARHAG